MDTTVPRHLRIGAQARPDSLTRAIRVRQRHHRARRPQVTRGTVSTANRYGLTMQELEREAARCVRDGWQLWELGERFGGRWTR